MKKKETPKTIHATNIGANIENVSIQNNAGNVSDLQAEAIIELAKASAEHARALAEMARS